MNQVNLRDPQTVDSRIYVGHLNETITRDLLDIKFSAYGRIVGFLQTQPGFAFIQYEQPSRWKRKLRKFKAIIKNICWFSVHEMLFSTKMGSCWERKNFSAKLPKSKARKELWCKRVWIWKIQTLRMSPWTRVSCYTTEYILLLAT